MRIVNLQEFRSLPDGTVFMKYDPCIFGELEVRQDLCGDRDFLSESLINIENNSSDDYLNKLDDAERDSSIELKLDFDYTGRDGYFEDEQLFAVLSMEDLFGLKDKIDRCLQQMAG